MHRVKEQMSVYQRDCTGIVHTAQETHKKSKHLCILSNNGPKGEAGMSGNDLIKPEEFMFHITDDEFNRLRLQIVTSNQRGGRQYLPYAFTEQAKRNIKCFLFDFMFQFTEEEVGLMVSQNGILSRPHLGGSFPFVFIEPGVATISAVLTSERGEQLNVRIPENFGKVKVDG